MPIQVPTTFTSRTFSSLFNALVFAESDFEAMMQIREALNVVFHMFCANIREKRTPKLIRGI